MPNPTKLLAIAAAGGALAIGVPAAFAAAGSSPDTPATTTQPVQQPQERPDGDDCPEKDGRGGGGAGSGSDQGPTTPDATATPDV